MKRMFMLLLGAILFAGLAFAHGDERGDAFVRQATLGTRSPVILRRALFARRRTPALAGSIGNASDSIDPSARKRRGPQDDIVDEPSISAQKGATLLLGN